MPASPDPDLALRQAKATVELYSEAVRQILVLVAARLARGIDEPGWAERKLLELVRLRDEAQAVLDRLTVAGTETIGAAIESGWAQGITDAVADLTGAGVELSASFGRVNKRVVERLAAETVAVVQSTHSSVLRQTLDTYRAVVAEAAGQVVTGVQSRRQAAQQALDRFAQRGITGFVDRAGRRWEVETYAEMALRTAVGRAQVAGTLDRFSAAGRDLVIVSDAPQECKICRRWEGRVLSITGASPNRPTVAEARLAGLFHANCRHRLAAWVPGRSRAMGRTADPEGDAARQEQRRLERGVRMWKRRAAVAVDESARRRAEAHAGAWQARLRAHVAANDLKRLPQRERLGAR